MFLAYKSLSLQSLGGAKAAKLHFDLKKESIKIFHEKNVCTPSAIAGKRF
jgi:hypothetical protein